MTNDFHATDPALAQARGQVEASLSGTTPRPAVHGLIDESTHTATFVVHDPRSRAAAAIDSVLAFDPAGTLSYEAADSVLAHVGEQGLTVAWILETSGHAAPLSAAPHLREGLGGRLGIGRGILQVQDACGTLFNAGTKVARTGAAFDRLFDEGDRFRDGRDGSVRDRGRLPRLPRRLSPGPGLRGRRRQRPLCASPALPPVQPARARSTRCREGSSEVPASRCCSGDPARFDAAERPSPAHRLDLRQPGGGMLIRAKIS